MARYPISGFSKYTLVGEGNDWQIIGPTGKPRKISRWITDGRPWLAGIVDDRGVRTGGQLGRLVLLGVKGEPPSPDRNFACHRDGDPSNNRVENLYWGTHADNMRDSVDHGRALCGAGERHWNSRLTDEDVAEIRRLWEVGWTRQQITDRYQIDHSHTCKIIKGTVRTRLTVAVT